MATQLSQQELAHIRSGYSTDPANTFSLQAEAYVHPKWFKIDEDNIIARSWQWVCHVEKLREAGSFVTVEVAGRPIAIVRDKAGALRAFYNVCKHRAHQLLQGEGRTALILCPYHAWSYRLDGKLQRAPHTEALKDFNTKDICLDRVQVEIFCGFACFAIRRPGNGNSPLGT
jgi:carnitine monooxygenase subunit